MPEHSSNIAVQFGAGNIGRGFIGALLAKSNYKVTFLDIDEEVVNTLNKQHAYKIEYLDIEKGSREIKNVHGALTGSPAMIDAIHEASIITTAVGANILKFIAPEICNALKARATRSPNLRTLNIIACENLVGNTSLLKDLILKSLAEEQDETIRKKTESYISQHVGFPNCCVDRIVPPYKGDAVLDVGVERFREWIVDETEMKKPYPEIDGMTLTKNLTAYVQRKLFTLNTGHAITAYLGFVKHYDTIDQAIADKDICSTVLAAMKESGAALVKEHSSIFNKEDHEQYINKILSRFKNPHVVDEIDRVGREPKRKLAVNDRLIGPCNMAAKYGLPVDHLLRGVAAAFLYWVHAEMEEDKSEEEVRKLVVETTEWKGDDERVGRVIENYRELEREWKSKQ
ncbi:mannitol-1-phosphate 5-dehydrogenase [Ascobolus immersus RN42]|uniref:Mannitol-1-phosphate 5-dehydrogenase n=1 Tax=Ascobolus immersus RN42 TaxID=1160509 RepID=A0A3N4HHX5_ASCIM|nr:mannitol-1-phosphate 5-dehydrogenase [Ascobolus immersus RN42]